MFGNSGKPERPEAAGVFLTTHWSVVVAAGQPDSPEGKEALERLCTAYWYPIYSFVRRRGHEAIEAQDLTQSFFARLLERNDLISADSRKGRFRTFLLACAQNFLANEWDKQKAQKRGGHAHILSLDEETANERYLEELASEASPEQAYERRWVEALLETVLSRLQKEFDAAGKGNQFSDLKVYLSEERGAAPFAEMATRFGVSEAALKGVVRRMRQRYREIFREEVANTVADPREVDEEIRHLISTLGAAK